MNIYNALRNAAHTFEFTENTDASALPIGAHGIIGDGCTCALVRADGCINWLCMPRFDSPTVFGSLVGAAGGQTWIRPASFPFISHQRYDPETNVLETLFEATGQGTIRLVDYMPMTDDPRASIHEVHRRIECLEGRVDVELLFDPRFDYGQVIPTFHTNSDGVVARAPTGDSLVCAVSREVRWADHDRGGVHGQVKLESGDRMWVVLSWNAPDAEPIAAYRPFEHLRRTRKFWRAWAHSIDYDGPWRDQVVRSALVLKLLLYSPTGAMVAAPTSSLPEWIGGERNWDYRYTWIRDAAMSIRAANLVGCGDEARDFFHFVRDVLAHDRLRLMYTITGEQVPDELVLEHLEGYRGSKPFRIGNGARDQLQLDTPGYLLDAAYLHERTGGTITLRMWRSLRSVVNWTMRNWRKPDHGIWEPRGEMRHNVHSKLLCWAALDRGARIASFFNDGGCERVWRGEAERARQEILDSGFSEKRGAFVGAYGTEDMDATLLLMPSYGFLPPDDPRVRKTVDTVRGALMENGYIYRYHYEDGLSGKEGAFILCGFWLAEALAISGRIAEAHDVFIRHIDCANHLGLLAEEVDAASGELLGNFPQAFSHLGLINAAARIDLALRLRDEQSARTPRFSLDV